MERQRFPSPLQRQWMERSLSADSMQVYRGMDIGSTKIRKEEMQGVRHHLIDICDPCDEFHVVNFQKYAKDAIQEISGRGKIPVLTGGTGFYIQAVRRMTLILPVRRMRTDTGPNWSRSEKNRAVLSFTIC